MKVRQRPETSKALDAAFEAFRYSDDPRRPATEAPADDAHELVEMRQMENVSGTPKRICLRLRQRRCDAVENSLKKRWALVAPREERRSWKCA